MSNPKFTPGPWRVDQGKQQSLTIRCGTQVLAEIPGYKVGVRFNNAHLIAAAPELYEAAQVIVERWDSPLHKFDALTGHAINNLRAALAKARGES